MQIDDPFLSPRTGRPLGAPAAPLVIPRFVEFDDAEPQRKLHLALCALEPCAARSPELSWLLERVRLVQERFAQRDTIRCAPPEGP